MRKLRSWYRIARITIWLRIVLLREALLLFLWKRIIDPGYWHFVIYLERLAHEGKISPVKFFSPSTPPPEAEDRHDGVNRHAR